MVEQRACICFWLEALSLWCRQFIKAAVFSSPGSTSVYSNLYGAPGRSGAAHRCDHKAKPQDCLPAAAAAAAADEGLMLRPVDVRTTGTTKYEDPLHVDEAIAFYRVSMDPALRELHGEGQ